MPNSKDHLHGDLAAASMPDALPSRNALALIAVERTRMPMVITDPKKPDNPIVLANQAFLDLTGYSADEVIGKNCRFMQGEATDRTSVRIIKEAVESERELTIEIYNYHKNGTGFWNQLYLSPIYDDQGELVYFFASQLDVSKRRRAQELEVAEHRLLKEIDHRAMNVLAIVEGIVRQTRGGDDVAAYVKAVHGRIHALAGAHSLLAERRWIDVPLSQLLAMQLDHNHCGGRARLSGPDVKLIGNCVQSLALVFHELITNAVAHGALASKDGSIEIGWRWDEAHEGFAMSWVELGGAAPSAERPPGFGARIIGTIIERQLRGTWTPTWTEQGLSAELAVPGCASQVPATEAP